jgi:hypothetical protein
LAASQEGLSSMSDDDDEYKLCYTTLYHTKNESIGGKEIKIQTVRTSALPCLTNILRTANIICFYSA